MPSLLRKYSIFFFYFITLTCLGTFVKRENFEFLFTLISVSFACYYFLTKEVISIKEIFLFGVGLRLIFLFLTPTLSDDYFRFIWDGKMILSGISPYAELPSNFILTTEDSYFNYLFEHLNSPDYYSVYPPISQMVYTVSALINNELVSLVILRIFLITAEIFSFIYLRKLLQHFGKDEKFAIWYFLNPLIIIELTGNLHFEGIMLCFLLISIYFILKGRYLASVLFFSIAVGVKLLPLIFLPFMLFKLPKEWVLKYLVLAIILTTIQFLPFVNIDLIFKMLTSIELYFQSFEFNASIYYLLRWIGMQIYGYNMIKIIGLILGLISLFSIFYLSYYNRNNPIFTTFLLLNSVYLLLATTIHPWYLAMMIAFSVFTFYKYMIMWSLFIFLSYSAYQTEIYKENLFLVGIEYLMVIGFLVYERSKIKITVND